MKLHEEVEKEYSNTKTKKYTKTKKLAIETIQYKDTKKKVTLIIIASSSLKNNEK